MKRDIFKPEVLLSLKNLVLVVLGTLTLALGNALFIIPYNLVAGGVTGTAIILSQFIPEEFITIDLMIAVLSWSLFFIGLIILGREFALKTFISTAIYPLSISFFSALINSQMLGEILSLSGEHSGAAPLLAALFGGVFVGCGCALTFLGGGSTGGMDIIAFILCKFIKKLKSSVAIFILDAAVILIGLFAIKSLTLTLLGIVTAFISAIVIDRVFLGGSKALVAQIITEKGDEIRGEIIQNLHRTTTEISVMGGFLKTPRKLLLVSFTMRQYAEFISLVNRVDPEAFVTVYKAHEISGLGWTR